MLCSGDGLDSSRCAVRLIGSRSEHHVLLFDGTMPSGMLRAALSGELAYDGSSGKGLSRAHTHYCCFRDSRMLSASAA